MNNTNDNLTTHYYSTRLASEKDASVVREISLQTFCETFAAHNTEDNMKLYVEKVFTLPQITNELRDSNNIFILAEDGKKLVGYAKLREGKNPVELDNPKAIEVERIYSISEYLGKNVGKTLMQACIDLARKRHYKVVWLGVWEHNPRAIAFYEKWGFKKFGAHPFRLGSDLQTDLLMMLVL